VNGYTAYVGRASRTRLAVLVGAYALVILGSPLFHHDIACHLKSATHCDACTANPMASPAESGPSIAEAHLPDAGDPAPAPAVPDPAAPRTLAGGRAPPA
jgi:hypothetical protein